MGNINIKKEKVKGRCENTHKFIEHNLDNGNWMQNMSEYIRDIKLKDLRLIRAHQSATYSIKSFLEKVSICQDADIYYQLLGGVRVLDFRPGSYKDIPGEILCGHGPHHGMKMIEGLNHVKDFLDKHTKEFIIIEFESAGKFLGVDHEISPTQKMEFISLLNEIFKDKLIRSEDTWFDISKTTMGEIFDNNKQVLIISHSFILNLGDSYMTYEEAKSLGIWDMIETTHGRFANTTDRQKMVDHVAKYLEEIKLEDSINSKKLLSANIQLTPQTIDSVYNLNKTLHDDEFIYEWFTNAKKDRLNILGYDFVFYNPQFLREIILSNYYLSHKIQQENCEIPVRHLKLENSNEVIYDKDIYKIKCSSSNEYLIVKKGKLLFSTINHEKFFKACFQIHLIEDNTNSIKIKCCSYTSKKGEDQFLAWENEELTLKKKGSLFKLEFNTDRKRECKLKILLGDESELFGRVLNEATARRINHQNHTYENPNFNFTLEK